MSLIYSVEETITARELGKASPKERRRWTGSVEPKTCAALVHSLSICREPRASNEASGEGQLIRFRDQTEQEPTEQEPTEQEPTEQEPTEQGPDARLALWLPPAVGSPWSQGQPRNTADAAKKTHHLMLVSDAPLGSSDGAEHLTVVAELHQTATTVMDPDDPRNLVISLLTAISRPGYSAEAEQRRPAQIAAVAGLFAALLAGSDVTIATISRGQQHKTREAPLREALLPVNDQLKNSGSTSAIFEIGGVNLPTVMNPWRGRGMTKLLAEPGFRDPWAGQRGCDSEADTTVRSGATPPYLEGRHSSRRRRRPDR